MKNSIDGKTVLPFLRDGRFQHIPGVLDQEPPWLVQRLIRLLCSSVIIDDYVVERIRELSRGGPLVYAMKYRSILDLHLLRLRLAEHGLPLPSYVFGTASSASWSVPKWAGVWRNRLNRVVQDRGWVPEKDEAALKEIFDHGGAGVIFLVDEKTSRDRYVYPERDPIRILVDLQGKVSGAITVVPLVILYDRTRRPTIRPFWESFAGDPDQPGLLRRLLIATRKWTVPELLIGEPAYLVGEFEEFGSDKSWEELPFSVRKELVDAINARIRVNRGPERLSRTEIKERVLQDPRVQKAVNDTLAREAGTEEKIRKKAESFVDEMAGDQHIQMHHFLYHVLMWLFRKMFDGIDLRESDFRTLKNANEQGSLIYVSCHKSHLDYLLIGFFSFVNQMAIPFMAAGKNLSFWPVGPVLRNAGAFFIRRSFKGLGLYTRLYTQVFAAYLKVLVSEKVNINFYIEGGRSRTGKLLPPRTGMLAFLVQTVEEGSIEDLTFVPTFIGYDQIPEESSYLRELAGREKQKETLGSLVRARELLKKRFGKVYVRFHEPLSFRDFCSKVGIDLKQEKSLLKEHRRLLNDFAYFLMTGIVRTAVVTPIELVAAGLMCWRTNRVSRSDLLDAVRFFADSLHEEGIEFAESLDNLETVMDTTLGHFRVRGFVGVEAGESEQQTIYVINESKRANLDFYRNALVNYLWPQSLAAAILLGMENPSGEITASVHEDFRYLKELLSKEIIADPLQSDDELLDRVVEFFRRKGWVSPGPSVERSNTALECMRGISGDLLAVYYLAVIVSETIEQDGATEKDFTRRMMETSQKMLTGDHAAPMLASVTVRNALGRFSEMGIFESRPGRRNIVSVADGQQRDRVATFLSRSVGWPASGRDD